MAVRVHADRVHDAVRRLGCGPDAAVATVGASALDLVDAVATDPESVGDPVGWWFARARELGRTGAGQVTVGSPDEQLPVGGGVLSGDANQARLAEALESLPERERAALLLRDSYALPAAAVGTALALEPEVAMELVARARLAFLPRLLLGTTAEQPGSHSDLPALARLAAGGPVAARHATTRRHAQSCDTCSAVLDVQERAHRLLSGLTVVALPEADRIELLDAVQERARQVMPLAVLASDDDAVDGRPRRILPLSLAALLLLLAAGAGTAVGLYASRGAPAPATQAVGGPATFLTAAPVLRVPAAPRLPPVTAPATAQVFTLTPSPTPVVTTPPPTSPPPSATPSPTALPATLSLSPTSGPNGTQVTVLGTGWTPGATVQLGYRDSTGALTPARARAVADANGTFTATLTATDPKRLPGPHQVTAGDGRQTVSAPFTAN